jgi:thiamine biosynthesis protein ThiS
VSAIELGAGGMPESGLEIRLNGGPHRLPHAMTLRELVESVGCDARAVAVEVIGEIVRKAELAATGVADGDAVEIVRFVQGG